MPENEITPPAPAPNASVPPVPPVATPPTPPAIPPVEPAAPVTPPEPVVPPTPPIAPEPPKPTEPPVAKDVPVETDFITSAKSILSTAGLDPEVIAKTITEANGEVSPELREQLTEKLGAAQTNLLVNGWKQERTSIETSQQEAANKVYEAVGGKEMWDKAAAWTTTEEANLTPESAKAYNDMLAQGGIQAELAAKAIMEEYMASPGFTTEPNLMQGDENPNKILTTQPISRSEYVKEKAKAFSENDGVKVKQLEDRARFTMDKHSELWRGTRING